METKTKLHGSAYKYLHWQPIKSHYWARSPLKIGLKPTQARWPGVGWAQQDKTKKEYVTIT